MKLPELIAVCGMPATGKTTLFREVMKRTGGGLSWWPEDKPFAHHKHSKSGSVILGDYSKPVSLRLPDFAGTDRLSMSVQKQAVEFCGKILKSGTASAILFEGDRLGNNSFFDALNELSGNRLLVVELFASEFELARRHEERKDSQTEKWLAGRTTKLANIRRARPVDRRPNGNKEQLAANAEYLIKLAGLSPPA